MENKCKHEGYWFKTHESTWLKIFFRKYLWCYKCLKPIKEKDVFKNADILHVRDDGYFMSSYKIK